MICGKTGGMRCGGALQSGPGGLGRKDKAIGVVVIAALSIVVFWEVMANRSRRPFAAFDITAEDFRDFTPVGPGWTVRKLPVGSDKTEPNILGFEMVREVRVGGFARGQRVVARLVHGYNMPDCMRLKGYKVELLAQPGTTIVQNAKAQLWRLTAADGASEVWLTSMVAARSFEETGLDVRTMPFPRISAPVDSAWVSRGITLETLRHPVAALRTYLLERWNSSRCDLATFLRLRQPAWASEELLTVVVAARDADDISDAVELVAEGYAFFLGRLVEWRGRRVPGGGRGEGG